MKRILSLLFVLFALFSQPAFAGEKGEEIIKASSAVVAGAAAGGTLYASIGGGGLAIAGTAIGIGAGPFLVAGMIVGMAGYGVYRVMTDEEDKPSLEKPKK